MTSVSFVAPMFLLSTNKLPEGPNWLYEIKLDGFRAIGFKSTGRARHYWASDVVRTRTLLNENFREIRFIVDICGVRSPDEFQRQLRRHAEVLMRSACV